MDYIKPQVLVYQEVSTSPSSSDTELCAWVVGPNGVLHRYSEASEKLNTSLGSLQDLLGTTTSYPGKAQLGNPVDVNSVKVYADNAKLQYAELTDTDRAVNVYGTSNLVEVGCNVATNGTYLRSSAFERDVKPGDFLRLSTSAAEGVAGEDVCSEVTFESEIVEIAPKMVATSISEPTVKTNSALYGTADPTTTAGTCPTGYTLSQGTYAKANVFKLVIGDTEDNETAYTVQSSLTGETVSRTAEHTMTSGTSPAFASVTYILDPDADLSVSSTELPVENTTLYFVIRAQYGTAATAAVTSTKSNPSDGKEAVALTTAGTYSTCAHGRLSTTYTVTITKIVNTSGCKSAFATVAGNGFVRQGVQIPLADTNGSTSSSFDISEDGELTATLTGKLSDLAVGNKYSIVFTGDYKPVTVGAAGSLDSNEDVTYVIQCISGGSLSGTTKPVVSVSSSDGMEYFMGTLSPSATTYGYNAQIELPRGITIQFSGADGYCELAAGDTYTIAATSISNGPVKILRLRESLPHAFRDWGETTPNYLDTIFFVKRNVQLESDDFTAASGNITFANTVQLADPDFDSVTVLDAEVYVEYREWVQSSVELRSITSMDELNAIPGQLDPDNPLKYGVYKAWANSNGVPVYYTPVVSATPETDLSAWSEALVPGTGTTDVYTIVPLTQNRQVQNLVYTVVNGDSNEQTCAWKHAIFNTSTPDKQVVASTRGVIIADSEGSFSRVVLSPDYAINPQDVTVGDRLCFMYQGVLTNFRISDVVSGTELSIEDGPTSQVGTGSEEADNFVYLAMNIQHTLTTSEQVAYVSNLAGTFSSPRVELVWPDTVGEGGRTMPGYMLCAALAGLMSGVQPHQGLTRVEIAGFDDFSRSYPHFTSVQLRTLASNGVWIVLTDKDGTAYTYHATTTDPSDINSREEMIVRNMDSLSMYFSNLLKPFIGDTVITPELLDTLNSMILLACKSLAANYYSIGPRLLEYSVTSIEQDILLKDRINILLNVTLPYATNNIALYIFA